jgi:hypothetical protein
LVQVIVPPTVIETGFGEYAVVVNVDEPLTIDTGVPVAVDGADGVEPQAMVKPINPATTLNRSLMCFSIRWGRRKGVATSEHPAILTICEGNADCNAFFVSENSNAFLTA